MAGSSLAKIVCALFNLQCFRNNLIFPTVDIMIPDLEKSLDEIIRSKSTKERHGNRQRRSNRGHWRGNADHEGQNHPYRRPLRREWDRIKQEEDDQEMREEIDTTIKEQPKEEDIRIKDEYRQASGDQRRSRRGKYLPKCVRIENLSYDISEDDLRELFSSVGEVMWIRIEYDRTGRSTGVAFVRFNTSDQAFAAVHTFDGKRAAGQKIFLRPTHQTQSARARDPTEWEVKYNSRTLEERRQKYEADMLDRDLDSYMSSRSSTET